MNVGQFTCEPATYFLHVIFIAYKTLWMCSVYSAVCGCSQELPLAQWHCHFNGCLDYGNDPYMTLSYKWTCVWIIRNHFCLHFSYITMISLYNKYADHRFLNILVLRGYIKLLDKLHEIIYMLWNLEPN